MTQANSLDPRSQKTLDILLALYRQENDYTREIIAKYGEVPPEYYPRVMQKRDKSFANLSQNTKIDLSPEILEKYQEDWNLHFYHLAGNPQVTWSAAQVDKYFESLKYGFEALFQNPGFEFSLELNDKYQSNFKWRYALSNLVKWTGEGWTAEIIEAFAKEWYWPDLSKNPKIPFSMALLEKYQDKWDWAKLSENPGLNPSLATIQKFKDLWKLDALAQNPSLPINKDNFEQFTELFDPWYLSFNPTLLKEMKQDEIRGIEEASERDYDSLEDYKAEWFRLVDSKGESNAWHQMGGAEKLTWARDFLGKYTRAIDFNWLSTQTEFPWTADLAQAYGAKVDWKKLMIHPSLLMTEEIIRDYGKIIQEKIALSDWAKIQWSKEGLVAFYAQLDQEEKDTFCERSRIPFEALEAMTEQLNWASLSQNPNLDWSQELLLKFIDRWDWGTVHIRRLTGNPYMSGLLANPGIPWDLDLIHALSAYLPIRVIAESEHRFLPWLSKYLAPEINEAVVIAFFEKIE